MKKFFEEKRDLLAGIFAVLAFIAIICEIAFSGFTKESFVSGVKDMSGILIDVLVLLVAASALIRKPVNFKDKFTEAMDSIKEKYHPLLIEDKTTEDESKDFIRYNIAGNSDALFSNSTSSFSRIFELDKNNPDSITFYVNKKFFNHRGGTDYNPEMIADKICLRLQSVYKDYTISTLRNNNNYSIRVDFNHTLDTSEDIDMLISLIDYTILLFVAKNQS